MVASVARLGYFLNAPADKFYVKITHMFSDFLGYFQNRQFLRKSCCGHFLGTFGLHLLLHLVTLMVASLYLGTYLTLAPHSQQLWVEIFQSQIEN